MVTSSLARMRVNMSREEQEMMEMNMTSSSATYRMMSKSTTTVTRMKWMLTMTTMPGGLDHYSTTLVALVFKLTNFCCLRMMSLEWSMQEDLMVEEQMTMGCGALPG